MSRKILTLLIAILSFAPIVAQTKASYFFNERVKQLYPSEICDFIERYANECIYWDNTQRTLYQKLYDDRVLVLEGEIHMLLDMPDTCTFSLIRYDNKAYEAIWQNDSITLRMAFPIRYELLLGKSRKELEMQLYGFIQNATDTFNLPLPPLNLVQDSIIYRTSPCQNYQIPEMTNSTYYLKQDSEYCIILDTNYIDFSMRNIVLAFSEFNPIIHVIQRMYGYQQSEYNITLWQWLAYCQQENLTIYMAFKEETEDSYILSIIAESKDFAYNHLLNIAIPRDFLSGGQEIWLMQISAFIPTHNLKNLYKQ